MEMTAPVLVKIPEETKLWEPAIYTLNFLLPAAHQEKPPAPTNDKVIRVHPPPSRCRRCVRWLSGETPDVYSSF